jgi:hypothetical protein
MEFDVTLLASRILKWHLDFLNLCTPDVDKCMASEGLIQTISLVGMAAFKDEAVTEETRIQRKRRIFVSLTF